MNHIQSLISTVSKLRGPDGCPWDKKQTILSLTPYILEETYEWVDAIKKGSVQAIQEEAGDVLLQVVMICQIAAENNWFDFENVANSINQKMIDRHPHVFGDVKVIDVDEVWKNWESIKAKKAPSDGLFDSIPKALPALMRADKVQKKVARQGFDWTKREEALEKLREEVDELEVEIQAGNSDKIRNELGDVLFSVTNVARKHGFSAEEVLNDAIQSFKFRYTKAIEIAGLENKSFATLGLVEKEIYWQKAKKELLNGYSS